MKQKRHKNKLGTNTAQKPKWLPENALNLQQLQTLVVEQRIKGIVIQETEYEDFWIGVIEKRHREMKFLTTWRAAIEPRRFKKLDVIRAFLRREVGIDLTWSFKLFTNINNLKQKRST